MHSLYKTGLQIPQIKIPVNLLAPGLQKVGQRIQEVRVSPARISRSHIAGYLWSDSLCSLKVPFAKRTNNGVKKNPQMMVSAPIVQRIHLHAEANRHVKCTVTPFYVETLAVFLPRDKILHWYFVTLVQMTPEAFTPKRHCQELQ